MFIDEVKHKFEVHNEYGEELDNNFTPIHNDDVIRMFHGFNDIEDAMSVALYGISGKRYISSLDGESAFNPYGLFITNSFRIATQFSLDNKEDYDNIYDDDGKRLPDVIMEFSARVSDLDYPVWNSCEYKDYEYGYGGENDGEFKSKAHRQTKHRQYMQWATTPPLQRPDIGEWGKTPGHTQQDWEKRWLLTEPSDNPALADRLFMGEYQALFIGELNPNMIKRFWVYDDEGEKWTPFARKAFIKHFGRYFDDNRVKSRGKFCNKPRMNLLIDIDHPLLLPKDSVDWEKLQRNYIHWYEAYYQQPCGEKVVQAFISQLEEAIQKSKQQGEITYKLTKIFNPKQLIELFGEDMYQRYMPMYDKNNVYDKTTDTFISGEEYRKKNNMRENKARRFMNKINLNECYEMFHKLGYDMVNENNSKRPLREGAYEDNVGVLQAYRNGDDSYRAAHKGEVQQAILDFAEQIKEEGGTYTDFCRCTDFYSYANIWKMIPQIKEILPPRDRSQWGEREKLGPLVARQKKNSHYVELPDEILSQNRDLHDEAQMRARCNAVAQWYADQGYTYFEFYCRQGTIYKYAIGHGFLDELKSYFGR